MNCLHCNTVLTKRQKFCSHSCSATYNNIRRVKRGGRKTCKGCGETFTSRAHNKRFCCAACRLLWSKANPRVVTDSMRESFRRGGQKSCQHQQEHRRSENEKAFYERCLNVYPDAIHNVAMFNGWDADVILPSHRVAIMWNGPWHYRQVTKQHNLKQVQNRDRIKSQEIERAGYRLFVIRDDSRKGRLKNEELVDTKFNELLTWLQFRGIEPR